MRKMLLFIGVLCLIVFCFFYYKTLKFGNNINNKKGEELIDYILNDMEKYESNIEVTVYSNKTENRYVIKQKVEEGKSIQKILEPKNLEGMEIELYENCLKIKNPKLNLEKVYEKYEVIFNNSLFLDVFARDYKENISKCYELENEIILETEIKNQTNTYAKYKELHISKDSKSVTSMIIKDKNKNVRVNIKYNDIEIK